MLVNPKPLTKKQLKALEEMSRGALEKYPDYLCQISPQTLLSLIEEVRASRWKDRMRKMRARSHNLFEE